ncbi:hypothetical protein ACOMHN_023944 [Nucella lapillus]
MTLLMTSVMAGVGVEEVGVMTCRWLPGRSAGHLEEREKDTSLTLRDPRLQRVQGGCVLLRAVTVAVVNSPVKSRQTDKRTGKMVSWKTLVLVLVLFILIDELDAQESRPRNANRRNRNRGNRGRARGGRRGGRGRNAARSRCVEIQVPMCKGLVGYTHTRLPNKFNHTSQLEVYRVLEHMWAQIDTGCSQNFRLLTCSLYLPRCVGRGVAKGPCRKTCKVTQRVCEPRLEALGYSWPEQFDCKSLPKKRCLKHGPHHSCSAQYTLCQDIDLPMCQSLSFRTGMSPNMFGQCNSSLISVEMQQFQPLVDTGCSSSLNFFMCGVYMPFCTASQGLMSFPCRELCDEVRRDCEGAYSQMTGGLPWPNKFQCHRYPLSSDTNYTCVMPDEGAALSLT